MDSLNQTATELVTDLPSAKLTDLELRILDFERQWWRYAGAKESALKELFNMNPPAYYQLLNNLIDREDALLFAPMLVKRLRRLREARTNARSTHLSA
ncbi:MAG: DUF3263 domain-containing protein [Actinomycetes bacterium]